MSKLSDNRGGFTYSLDPETIVVIEDKDHPRYDPRVERDIDEGFLASLEAEGILKPVLITKDDEGRFEALDGRRRIRGARQVNAANKGSGKPKLMVPCVYLAYKDDAWAAKIRQAANLHEGDPPTYRAARMAEYVEKYKWPLSTVAQVFGIGEQMVKQYLALSECSELVRADVDRGGLALGAAYKLSKLPRNEQGQAIVDMREGKRTGGASEGNGGAKGTGRKKRPGLSREQIRKFYDVAAELGDEELDPAVAVTRWFLGEITAAGLTRVLPALKPAVEAVGLE